MARSTFQKIAATAVAGTAVTIGGGLSIGTATAAPATETTAQTPADGVAALEQTNESELALKARSGATLTAAADGHSATIAKDGKSETLPTDAKDKNGAPVTLHYVQDGDGVRIQVIDLQKKVDQPAPGEAIKYTNWVKCGLGTVGGGGTGGLAGAGVGTTVPVIGTTVGAVVGGVSGAATGAAASCF